MLGNGNTATAYIWSKLKLSYEQLFFSNYILIFKPFWELNLDF